MMSTEKSAASKMGIKVGAKAFFVNAPESFVTETGLSQINLKKRCSGSFDYIHFFVVTQAEFHKRFENLKRHLNSDGTLWVSWPKSGQLETDLNIKIVIELGYGYGLVESKSISVNPIWSGLKFTFPKAGKQYNNSFGQLKSNQ